jgi:hypothetical protein
MMNVQGNQAPAKQQNIFKKFENSSTKTVTEQSMNSRHCWDQLESLTENLYMHHTATKFVHSLLTNDQKQLHINVCLEFQEKTNENSTFISISRNIMGDKNWIYGYDPDTKQQTS